MKIINDIETNGLLDQLTKIHTIVAYDQSTNKSYSFCPQQINEAVLFLEDAQELIAHNGF
ncbi:hypothetical protein [Zooshikella sp. RANM57]|uniref:hypothetical protein n=1 Tax=Zooshikella sp. RANM57 TaxID=3425863 RepID=UPI003D6DA989